MTRRATLCEFWFKKHICNTLCWYSGKDSGLSPRRPNFESCHYQTFMQKDFPWTFFKKWLSPRRIMIWPLKRGEIIRNPPLHWMVQLHWLMQSRNGRISHWKWRKCKFNLQTPLHFALILNHEEFVLLLIQNARIFQMYLLFIGFCTLDIAFWKKVKRSTKCSMKLHLFSTYFLVLIALARHWLKPIRWQHFSTSWKELIRLPELKDPNYLLWVGL